MKTDDVSAPTHHEHVWDGKRFSVGVGVDWCAWALPAWVSFGPMDFRRPDGTWKRLWAASLWIGPFMIGVSW